MASTNAVKSKANFFVFPFQTKLSKKKKPEQKASQDTFAAPSDAAKLNKLPKKSKPQGLSQGDEAARKGGFWDLFGCLAIFALCCACCEGSGNNNGYRNRGWNSDPKPNKLKKQPPAPPVANTTEPAVV